MFPNFIQVLCKQFIILPIEKLKEFLSIVFCCQKKTCNNLFCYYGMSPQKKIREIATLPKKCPELKPGGQNEEKTIICDLKTYLINRVRWYIPETCCAYIEKCNNLHSEVLEFFWILTCTVQGLTVVNFFWTLK